MHKEVTNINPHKHSQQHIHVIFFFKGAGVESVRKFIRLTSPGKILLVRERSIRLTSPGKILVRERFIQQTSRRQEVGAAAVIKRTKNETSTTGGGQGHVTGHVTGTAAGERGEEVTMPTS